MKELVISIFLISLSIPCQAVSDLHCKAYMLMRETNGTKSIKMQRAVLDVMHNRQNKWKKNSCYILSMKGQYPYAKYGIKPVSKYWLTHADKLSRMTPLLDKDYLYFNTIKHKGGKECIRVGSMWFCK